ncbi:MAG: sucrose phosphorylase [Sphaerochaetaceae bacterium]
MKNGVMLITYPDSLGSNLSDLHTILSKHFNKALSSLHILPFFPSSGDRGFAPYTYEQVDPAFGTWKDIDRLAKDYDLVFDYMINHISAKSPLLQEYLSEGPDSSSQAYFIDYETFWGGEPSEEQTQKIYKRKPKDPYVTVTFASGEQKKLWCTFSEEQIDLNLQTKLGISFMEENLARLARHGAKLIRLDAFAYAIKKKDTDCFFVEPETWHLLAKCRNTVEQYGADVLPEIHEHYSIQLKLGSNSYPVYDFALPMLMLHALYFHQSQYLKNWFTICSRNQYTTLDTHDGIGVVDVYGLLPDEEIEATKEHLYTYGANVKRIYNSETYNNLDIYQINCTYYSALGENDRAYLLARAVQFFSPGIPQIYYVGMLAGSNDLELLEETKEGRNINRHYYSKEEVDEAVERPVVVALRLLMELRSSHPAFEGTFHLEESTDEKHLTIFWEYEDQRVTLNADFQTYSFIIEGNGHILMRL